MGKHQSKRSLFTWALTAALSFSAAAQEFNHPTMFSFEDKSEINWENSRGNKLSISPDHYKHGKSSLMWDWRKTGSIRLNKNIGFRPFDPSSEDKSIPTFVVWIYNETPQKDHLTFSFGTDKTENCHFTFNLDFKGWRSAWVAFERDMEGTPKESMNFMQIKSPQSSRKGRLFIDHMFLCTPADSRHHTADHQVPFVNKATTMHWLILQEASQKKPDIALKKEISPKEKKAFKTIEKRFFNDIILKPKVTEESVNKLQKAYDKYKIEVKGEHVIGTPIWFNRNAELYIPLKDRSVRNLFRENGVNVHYYFDLMFNMGCAYNNCQDENLKTQLRTMYLNLFDHMVDQGIAAGSGLGTIHHYGYSWRNYYRALFIMKDLLRETGRLEEAINGMQWFSALGEVYAKPEKPGMSMDAFNTTVMGRLGSVLIMEDSPEKVQKLSCFTRWIDNGLQHAKGLDGAFKIDGSMFHHCNNYPAYAVGGLTGATRMVYFFSRTSFRVSQQGHENLRKSLMLMRLYCNLKEWPVSMAGRHPMKTEWSLIPSHYAIMAMAGTPDGKEKIDKKLAQAYLRLTAFDKEDKYSRKFKKTGLIAEENPNGSWNLPYASVNMHRRDEWSAVVRGHSRYLWAAEHYIGANYYGRYLAHGSLQINANGKPYITGKGSGYSQPGWDWNRIPGTTTIHVPLDILRANILNVDRFSGYEEMLYSDEAFAGGVTMDHANGLYAIKLHEHDKYEGSHRARKSYFFFDNRIICLGSNIENNQKKYPTETTLFQCSLENDADPIFLGEKSLSAFPLQETFTSSDNWVMDNQGHGYYLPTGQSVSIIKAEQHSRDQAKETPTKGHFASAILNHGKAPKNASYEYAMLVKSTPERMKSFAKNMEEKNNQPYKVLQKDKSAHIVFDAATQTTGYSIFEGNQTLANDLIQTSNIPCLVMTKPEGEKVKISICDPDLHLYEGPSDDVYKDGKRVERSIYSRPWIHNESQASVVEITLNGKWSVSSQEGVSSELSEKGNTILKVVCKDGLTKQFELLPL